MLWWFTGYMSLSDTERSECAIRCQKSSSVLPWIRAREQRMDEGELVWGGGGHGIMVFWNFHFLKQECCLQGLGSISGMQIALRNGSWPKRKLLWWGCRPRGQVDRCRTITFTWTDYVMMWRADSLTCMGGIVSATLFLLVMSFLWSGTLANERDIMRWQEPAYKTTSLLMGCIR